MTNHDDENNVRVLLEKKVRRADGKKERILSDDKRDIEALAMSARGIGAELTKEDNKAFDGIKQLQKEFQEKYCKTCVGYDPKTGDYIEKGHPNDPKNCKNHWTDIIGQCWNYRRREDAEGQNDK